MFTGELAGMKRNKVVIGLTGQSGSGKSLVASYIAQRGIHIIDCDKITHENMAVNGIAYGEIVSAFGNTILNEDLSINRKKLGSIVFSDSKKLELLNSISHKHIVKRVEDSVKAIEDICVIDAPLLIETGLNRLCSTVWAVVCPLDIRARRIVERDNISYEDALKRFKNQKDIDFYIKNSDVVIENKGDISSLKERIEYEIS